MNNTKNNVGGTINQNDEILVDTAEENLFSFFIEHVNQQSQKIIEDSKVSTEPSKQEKVKKTRRKIINSTICDHCNKTDTVRWRKGPKGRGTLCNACGLQFGKATRRLRHATHTAEIAKLLN